MQNHAIWKSFIVLFLKDIIGKDFRFGNLYSIILYPFEVHLADQRLVDFTKDDNSKNWKPFVHYCTAPIQSVVVRPYGGNHSINFKSYYQNGNTTRYKKFGQGNW